MLIQYPPDNALCVRRTFTLPQIACAHFHELILRSATPTNWENEKNIDQKHKPNQTIVERIIYFLTLLRPHFTIHAFIPGIM